MLEAVGIYDAVRQSPLRSENEFGIAARHHANFASHLLGTEGGCLNSAGLSARL